MGNRPNKEKLTLGMLEAFKPNTIFATGNAKIPHPYDGGSKKVEVNWVAIRGGIHDWSIYHSMDSNFGDLHLKVSNEMIAAEGAKLHDEKTIRALMPCTDEAFAVYRH